MLLNYPGVSAFARMRPRPADGMVIDDATALQIDKAVSALRLVSEDEHDVIARRFIQQQTYREIARDRGWRDHRRAAALVSNGVRFVMGVLYVDI